MCTLRSLCCLYKSPKWHILGTKTVQQKSHESWPCVSAQGDPVPNTGHSHYKPVPFIPQKNINRQRKFFPSTWLFQNEPNWESWKRSLGGHRSLARRDTWGEGSFSVDVEVVRELCRCTVLWNSLLLMRTTREKRRSWKWLRCWKKRQCYQQ